MENVKKIGSQMLHLIIIIQSMHGDFVEYNAL